MTAVEEIVAGSFRDPSGYVFRRNGTVYRRVNEVYRRHYDQLMQSGLYGELAGAGLLVAHEEERPEDAARGAYRILRPEPVPFLSYPYEWCFSELQRAALATLEIQVRALRFGMSLKDASAYNIQFIGSRPMLIDTLSFEAYQPGSPWIAYRQFCQHFLAPLAVMSYCDARLARLLEIHLDGIPLDLAAKLLPWRACLKPSLLAHVHLHARAQQRCAEPLARPAAGGMSERAMLGMIENLRSAVEGLRWRPRDRSWSEYYTATNYSTEAFEQKQRLVAEFLDAARPESVWDLGANTGAFSRLAAARGIRAVAFDFDPASVEANYLQCAEQGESRVLPLVLDVTNPSPAIGWALAERRSLVERGPADAVLALALVHHLAIANNVPLGRIAQFFAQIGRWLILEFVPKEDSQTQRLLASREDIFPDYTQEAFERSFDERFVIERRSSIAASARTVYLMRNRGPAAGNGRW